MCLLIAVSKLCAEEQTKTLSFDEKDFTFNTSIEKQLSIIPNGVASFTEDTLSPSLPYYIVNFTIPKDNDLESYVYTINDSVSISRGRYIRPNTKFKTALQSVSLSNKNAEIHSYSKTHYPNDNVKYLGASIIRNQKHISFRVTPFIYKTEGMELSLLRDICIKIIYDKDAESTNYNDANVTKTTNQQQRTTDGNSIDYLIITNNSLVNSFAPLVSWKRQKGLQAHIETIENINQLYNESSTIYNVKRYIQDCYTDNGLRYVLLGGDSRVIPVFNCRYRVNNEEENIASDLFYACLDNNFYWNQDGDTINGEVNDNIDLGADVIVTRIMGNTPSDISAYVSRVLEYEKNPASDKWNKKMLLCGNTLNNEGDAKVKGMELYNRYINPYWNGARYCFYDTYNYLAGGDNYPFTPNNINEQLSQRFPFVNITTHGSITSFTTETTPYTTLNVDDLSNQGYTVITTEACYTNNINTSYCLSAELQKSPNSGIIGYIGCSSLGWYNSSINELGPSFEFNGMYYNKLFSNTITNKNYGEVFYASKNHFIGNCTSENTYRWLMVGVNALGDPEMPIFTDYPDTFSDVSVTQNENNLQIVTNLTDCKVAVTSLDSINTLLAVEDFSNYITIPDVSGPVNIVITKQNYKPFIKTLYIIEGDNAFCDSTIYYINGLPDSHNVEWEFSAPYAYIKKNYPTANACMLVNRYDYAYKYNLTAKIKCDTTTIDQITREVYSHSKQPAINYYQENCYFQGVNHPSITTKPVNDVSSMFVHQGCMVHLTGFFGGYEIEYSGNPMSFNYNGSNEITFQIRYMANGPVTITLRGACGTKRYVFFGVSNNGNLTTSNVNISLASEKIIINRIDDSKESEYVVSIYNTDNGSLILKEAGIANKEINTHDWDKGVYVVYVKTEESTFTKKIIIE